MLRGVVGAAAVAVSGCGVMPALVGDAGRHPCTSRWCRYWVASPSAEAAAQGVGRCALVLREAGGEP